MKIIRLSLWIVCFTLYGQNSFCQKLSLVDSIIQSVEKQNTYKQKIGILHQNINQIYTTKYNETITLARLGYHLAEKQKDEKGKGAFLRNIGGAYIRKGDVDSASFYYHKALNNLKTSGNSEELGLLYDDMARMHRKLLQPERALSFYDKALALYEADNNLEGIARINNESGVVFRDKGDYKTANERFEKSLYIQRQRNDSVGMGYALEFLGYNQLLIKDFEKAENYLQQALFIRKRLKDDFALMLNYTALGEFYKETKQPLLSNEYFRKSNMLAKKISYPDIQMYNYGQITQNYEEVKNFEQAYYSLKEFNLLNDSLYNAKKLKDVEEITTRYETAEKENQILVQRAKITENQLNLKNRNQWIIGLSSLMVIISLIGFIVYKQQVLKNVRQQRENESKLALEKIETQKKLQEQKFSISRDLHDNIGAQLTFIISAIDTIKYYTNGQDDRLITKLDNIGAFAKDTIQELRDTIWAMNKSFITIKDLQTRIANFIEKAKHCRQDIKISITADNNIPADTTFTALEGLNIFRIIQEATNNALKYAEASHIKILIKKDSSIFFTIVDDGKGFTEKNGEQGNGLLNMRKRALELGSDIHLNSVPNKGTAISFYVIKK